MREQYLEYFQSHPVFLFDAGGHNGTGHHQFGAEITAQWWRAQPELRQLFSDFFAALCAGQIDEMPRGMTRRTGSAAFWRMQP